MRIKHSGRTDKYLPFANPLRCVFTRRQPGVIKGTIYKGVGAKCIHDQRLSQLCLSIDDEADALHCKTKFVDFPVRGCQGLYRECTRNHRNDYYEK